MFPLLDDNQFESSDKTVNSSTYPIIGIAASFGTAAIIAIAFFCRRYDDSVSYCIARWRKKESNPEIQPEKDYEYEREAQNSIDEDDLSQKICKPFRCCIFQDQTEEWTNAKHAQHIRIMRRQQNEKMNVYLKSTTTSGFRWKKKWRERKVISKQKRKLKNQAKLERNKLRQQNAENEANEAIDESEGSPDSNDGDESNVDAVVPDNRSFKSESSQPRQESEQDGYDADDDEEEEPVSFQRSQPEPANQLITSTDSGEIRRANTSLGLNIGK